MMLLSHFEQYCLRVYPFCDFCAKHGGGKKWYENEANFSKKLFEEEETQAFMHDFFSRSIEYSKQLEENLRSATNLTLKRIIEPKLQSSYSNYLHHQVIPTEVAAQIIKTASRACKFSCVCRKIYGDSTKYCIGLGFVPDVAANYPDYTQE